MDPSNLHTDNDRDGSGSNHEGGSLAQTTTSTCIKCGLDFQGKAKLDAHRKKVHQEKVNVKMVDGQARQLVRNQETMLFECPAQGCSFTQQDPKRIQTHVLKCQGQQVTSRMMNRDEPPSSGTLVQHGEEIEGEQSSRMVASYSITDSGYPVNPALLPYRFVWNKRTCLLICERCNKGVQISEAYTHLKLDDPSLTIDNQRVNKETLANILAPYLPNMIDSKLPIGWQKGRPFEAIEGLVMFDGFTCTLCGDHSFEKQESAIKHLRSCHPGQFSLLLLLSDCGADRPQQML